MIPEKKISKIMFIQPRYTVYKNDVRRCTAPLGLAYLAAFLRNRNYEVKILDVANEGYNNLKQEGDFVTYGLDDEAIKKEITDFQPHVVGVSCLFSTQDVNSKGLLKFIKQINKNIITLTGGAHPTFVVEELLDFEYVDYIVLGEGELTTLELLETLNNNGDVSKIKGLAYKEKDRKIINKERQYVKDINNLPLPARDLLNLERYFEINTPHNPYCLGKRVAQVLTSRGCPAQCVFCSAKNFWGNCYRERKSEEVIKEIKMLKEMYDIDEIQFTDDNISLNKKRAMEIFDGIKGLGLKWCAPNGIMVRTLDDHLLEKMNESGCYQLSFAVESGNQEVLHNIIKKPLNLEQVKPLVKKAQELGIRMHAFAICGFPGEKIEQMHETYKFISDCGFESASFFAANPLVGSELLKICRERGYLRKDMTHNDRLFKMGNITTGDFKAEEIQLLVEQFNKNYNKTDTREKRFEKEKY